MNISAPFCLRVSDIEGNNWKDFRIIPKWSMTFFFRHYTGNINEHDILCFPQNGTGAGTHYPARYFARLRGRRYSANVDEAREIPAHLYPKVLSSPRSRDEVLACYARQVFNDDGRIDVQVPIGDFVENCERCELSLTEKSAEILGAQVFGGSIWLRHFCQEHYDELHGEYSKVF